MIVKQDHIAIIVSQKERSVKFYRDVLGLEVLHQVERKEQNDTIIYLEGNGITLEMFVDPSHPQRLSNPEALGLRHLCFTVTDINEYRQRIIDLGYEPEQIKSCFFGKEMFFVKDPDGLPIEFKE